MIVEELVTSPLGFEENHEEEEDDEVLVVGISVWLHPIIRPILCRCHVYARIK